MPEWEQTRRVDRLTPNSAGGIGRCRYSVPSCTCQGTGLAKAIRREIHFDSRRCMLQNFRVMGSIAISARRVGVRR